MSQYTSPTPVPGFLDPDDPILFPRLTAAQIEQLAEHAETLSFSPGEILFEQGASRSIKPRADSPQT